MQRIRILIGIAVLVPVGVWLWPLPNAFEDTSALSVRITDRSGLLLYDLRTDGLQIPLREHEIPEDFRSAVIAVEDRTFRTNPGLSLRGILRAAWRDVRALRVVEGGSTITQQYVRSVLKPRSRGVFYKLREALLALKVTSRLPKDDILTRYTNTAYFGQRAYGLGAAARVYFDTEPEHLSLGQTALLAGLLNAPSALNPFKDQEAALERRHLVLRAMRDTGVISQAEFDEASAEPLKLSHGRVPIEAPHFVFWVLQSHEDLEGAKQEVKTTLNLPLQRSVESIITRRIGDLKEKNVTSAAAVVLDAKSGDVLAMVGSADYFDSDHDGAVNVALSARQPGSALKPFTYALAFSRGMTPATTIPDISTQFLTKEGTPYTPRNYDYREHGLVRLREALANSYNIPAVRLLERLGVGSLQSLLTRAGISTLTESPEHYGLALTLGDAEVRLLDLVAAYGAFARGGITLAPRSLATDPVVPGDRILDERVSWLMTSILSDNQARIAEFGVESALAFPFPVAAKTGTTRNSRDNWTVGYTRDFVVGVWVGNADNSPMRDTSGVTGAGPIFHDVVLETARLYPRSEFPRPDGIVELEICRLSGLLPTDLCKDRTSEFFVQGTEPTQRDNLHVKVPIDIRNGLRAGSDCPLKYVREELFTDLPPEARAWGRANGWKLPPQSVSPLCGEAPELEARDLVITRPSPGASYLLDPLIPDAQEAIFLEARTENDAPEVRWLVDGAEVGTGKAPSYRYRWIPTVGQHTIRAEATGMSSSVEIEVRR